MDKKKPTSRLYHAYILKVDDFKFWEKDVSEASLEEEEESVSSLFKEFVSSWDCDGPGRIYGSRSILRRAIWTILWSVMLGYGSYQCFNTYVEYQKHEKTVVIDIIDHDDIEFPAVTFCTLNPFSPQSEDWYQNNTPWNSFWELQQEFSSLMTEEQCNNLTYADQPANDTEAGSNSETAATGGETISSRTTITISSDPTSKLSASSYTAAPFTQSTLDLISSNPPSGRRKRSSLWEGDHSDLQFSSESDYFNEFRTQRSRRSASILDEPLVFPTASPAELLNIRINCSTTFQRLLYQYNLANGIDQPETLIIGDTSHCQYSANFSKKETLWPDPLCYVPVIEDVFGYYTEDTMVCNPVEESYDNSSTLNLCSTCCPTWGLSCANVTEYNEYLTMVEIVEKSVTGLYLVVNRSQTTDGSDLIGKFLLSSSDIENSVAPIHKVILTCSFDQTSCTVRDFQEWENQQYGRCYTFNSVFQFDQSNITTVKANARHTHQFGPKNGLRLTLDIKSKAILDLLSPEIGLRVVFHNPGTIPFPEDEGINVLPGVSTSVQVSLNEIKRQKPPWGKCGDVDWQPKYNYTRAACQKLCLEQLYRSQCNCYVGLSPAYSNLTKPSYLPQCSILNITQKFCLDNILFSFQQGMVTCNCPPSCQAHSTTFILHGALTITLVGISISEWVYEPLVSYSLPNKKYYQIIQEIRQVNLGDDICTGSGNSTIRLQVYLNALSTKLLQENQAYTLDTLVANIGGTMGLFVGVSIISCLEILEFLFNVFRYCVKKICCKPKRKNQSFKRSHVYIIHEQKGDQDFAYPKSNLKPMVLSSLDALNQNLHNKKQVNLSKEDNESGKMEKTEKILEKILFGSHVTSE